MASLHDEEGRTPSDLEVLDPSPVQDDAPEQEKQEPEYFPPQAQQPLQRSTTGLGLSNHGAPWYRTLLPHLAPLELN